MENILEKPVGLVINGRMHPFMESIDYESIEKDLHILNVEVSTLIDLSLKEQIEIPDRSEYTGLAFLTKRSELGKKLARYDRDVVNLSYEKELMEKVLSLKEEGVSVLTLPVITKLIADGYYEKFEILNEEGFGLKLIKTSEGMEFIYERDVFSFKESFEKDQVLALPYEDLNNIIEKFYQKAVGQLIGVIHVPFEKGIGGVTYMSFENDIYILKVLSDAEGLSNYQFITKEHYEAMKSIYQNEFSFVNEGMSDEF